MKRPACGLA